VLSLLVSSVSLPLIWEYGVINFGGWLSLCPKGIALLQIAAENGVGVN
jgi:hypothetical protein